MPAREWLSRGMKIAAVVVALLLGEYILFVLLALAYGGTVSGAGGSADRFVALLAFLAILDLVVALSVFRPRRPESLPA